MEDAVQSVAAFAESVRASPWGMLSKAQTEYLVFKLLVDTGHIDKDLTDFELANELSTTMTRVRSLRFRYEQEAVKAQRGKIDSLLTEKSFLIEDAREVGKIRVVVRSRYLRDFLAAELQKQGAIALTEMTPSTLLVTPKAFITVLAYVAGAPGKREWVTTPEGEAAVDAFLKLVSDSGLTNKMRARVETILQKVGATTQAVGGFAAVASLVVPHIGGAGTGS